jgi:hypothetical protein
MESRRFVRATVIAAISVSALVPLASPSRLAIWDQSFARGDVTVRDRLARSTPWPNGSVSWSDLARVESFLRTERVTDGDVLGFNEAPHVVYLDLDLKPPVRYMQFNLFVSGLVSHRDDVLRDLQAARPRFVVSDLVSIGVAPDADLPVPEAWRTRYPWNLPVAFRARRYVVQRAVWPASRFWR